MVLVRPLVRPAPAPVQRSSSQPFTQLGTACKPHTKGRRGNKPLEDHEAENLSKECLPLTCSSSDCHPNEPKFHHVPHLQAPQVPRDLQNINDRMEAVKGLNSGYNCHMKTEEYKKLRNTDANFRVYVSGLHKKTRGICLGHLSVASFQEVSKQQKTDSVPPDLNIWQPESGRKEDDIS